MQTSILDAKFHSRLLQDLDHVCEYARVQQKFVHHSMKEWCSEKEVDWVVNFNKYREEGVAGLLLSGKSSSDRCMAIAGALLRNFIDARVVGVNDLVGDAVPEPTVLLVHNLFVTTHGTSFTSWQIQTIYDVLLSRFTSNKPTVVYVDSIANMANAFGQVIAEHLEEHFIQV